MSTNFNEYQKKSINEINGNIAVIATAGSGKTTVLVERIRHMVKDCNIPARNILAISFSKKACENLVDRLAKYNNSLSEVSVHTFHALALRVVNSFYGGKYKVWTSIWEKEKLLTDICKRLSICDSDADIPTSEIFAYIAKQKVNMLTPKDKLINEGYTPFRYGDMAKIYREYEKCKEAQDYIEFDDLVNKACEIFKNNPNVLEKYQDLYQYILVDEYQDVSLNQNVFLHYLNGNNNIFAVGDSLQAIYSFRGGDCKYLLDFDKEWDNAKIFNLPINYRCSKNIVTSANKLAEFTPDSRSSFYKPAIADKGEYKKPVYKEFDWTEDESEYIGNTILAKVNEGYKKKDCAILTRTNAQLQNIQTVLADMGIGCDMADGLLFWDLSEIKLILLYFRLANDTSDNEAFNYCYNKPNRWLSKKFLEEVSAKAGFGSMYDAMFKIDRREWRFKGGIDEIHDVINTLQNRRFSNVKEMVKYLRGTLNIDTFVKRGIKGDKEEIDEKISNLDSLEEMCSKFDSIKSFLRYVDDNIKKQNDNSLGKDNVKLMTIHKSKGLEFPIVFVSGCSEGLLPHRKSDNRDDEKRLFYVAITRAEKELYLTHSDCCFNNFYEKSPFVDYLGDTVIGLPRDKKNDKKDKDESDSKSD